MPNKEYYLKHREEILAQIKTPEARAKRNENVKRYARNHPEIVRARWKHYYLKYRDKILAKQKNPEARRKKNEKTRRRQHQNPEKYRQHGRKYYWAHRKEILASKKDYNKRRWAQHKKKLTAIYLQLKRQWQNGIKSNGDVAEKAEIIAANEILPIQFTNILGPLPYGFAFIDIFAHKRADDKNYAIQVTTTFRRTFKSKNLQMYIKILNYFDLGFCICFIKPNLQECHLMTIKPPVTYIPTGINAIGRKFSDSYLVKKDNDWVITPKEDLYKMYQWIPKSTVSGEQD